MLKSFLVIFLIGYFLTNLNAQQPGEINSGIPQLKKDQSGKALFEETRNLSAGKDTLFLWAKEWVYKTYKSGDAVIQMEDKDAGLIICKGRTNSTYVKQLGQKIEAGTFRYNFKIALKDGKYRITINEITYERGELNYKSGADLAEDFPSNWPQEYYRKKSEKWWKEIKDANILEFQAIIFSLESHMTQSYESKW